jgi:hypothetical protein
MDLGPAFRLEGVNLAIANVWGARPCFRAILSFRWNRPSGPLFGNLSSPYLEGATILLVDDLHASPLPARHRL